LEDEMKIIIKLIDDQEELFIKAKKKSNSSTIERKINKFEGDK
jgi:hypothetical protein